ncbi:ParB/RepB/Spo0J family partition protein [Lentisalinibacter orientalis]|uniref:ParB/RepB/Spo0J family partition protein n=1 Tax=Lentisalinibacter orientalis TaxID=2992241 RepID=UPI00386A61EF
MVTKKKRLGRGLDALLSQSSARAAESGERPAAGESDTLREVPVDLLQRGRYQPRTDMRQESLEDLADSIRAQGVVQPIVVRPLDTTGDTTGGTTGASTGGGRGETRYEIVAGERRWRAAQLAGLDTIPAVVRQIPDEAAVAMALIENIQREDLNPLEEAMALSRLIAEFDMTHQQAAEAVGRSRAAVSNLLRLLELGEEVKKLVEARQLEMGHARALLALTDPAAQLEAARRVAKGQLSVRATEQLVQKLNAPGKKPSAGKSKKAVDPDIRRLESEVAERLGARVELEHAAGGKGRLVIRYNSLDELEGILEHIR